MMREPSINSLTILVLLLMVEAALSIYINFRMLFIIKFTAKKEWKSTYYPIILIMVTLTSLTSVLLGYVAIAPIIHDAETFDERSVVFAIAWPLMSPALISLLDLLLCMHRISYFFGHWKLLTIHFRWFGPLLFLIFGPFIGVITTGSFFFTIFDRLMTSKDPKLFLAFVADNVIRVLFGISSVGGYLMILLTLNRSNRQSMLPREDSVVLRQALPIASFQLFSAFIQLTMELPIFEKPFPEVNRLVLDVILSCTCSIVVPLSIIIGSTRKKRIFLKDWVVCCTQSRTPVPVRKYPLKSSGALNGRQLSKNNTSL